MKKNLLRIICILMALFMLPVYTFAAETPAQEENLTGAAAINYVQKNADFVGSEYLTVTTSHNNRLEFIVDTYTKTTSKDVTTAAMARSGDTATEYATTTYEVWNTRASNSTSGSSEDQYGYAIVSATLHYTDFTQNGNSFRQMIRMTGSYTIVSAGAEMRSHRYVLTEQGKNPNNSYSSLSRSYSVATHPTSWTSYVDQSLFLGIDKGADIPTTQSSRYYYTLSSTETGETWGRNFTLISYTHST